MYLVVPKLLWSIVFLHDVKDGPASQSYGIAVEGLGASRSRVIRHARQLLQKLEQRSVSNGPQLDLFAGGGGIVSPGRLNRAS